MPDDRRVNGSGSCRVDIVVASDGDRVKYNSYCRRIVVAIGTKWRAAMGAEAAVETGKNVVMVTQDMKTFFQTIDHEKNSRREHRTRGSQCHYSGSLWKRT